MNAFNTWWFGSKLTELGMWPPLARWPSWRTGLGLRHFFSSGDIFSLSDFHGQVRRDAFEQLNALLIPLFQVSQTNMMGFWNGLKDAILCAHQGFASECQICQVS